VGCAWASRCRSAAAGSITSKPRGLPRSTGLYWVPPNVGARVSAKSWPGAGCGAGRGGVAGAMPRISRAAAGSPSVALKAAITLVAASCSGIPCALSAAIAA
jgi:hypothetical protein